MGVNVLVIYSILINNKLLFAHIKKGQGDDAIIMNIGKKSKLSTQSMRPHFEVGRGSNGDEEYEIVAGK